MDKKTSKVLSKVEQPDGDPADIYYVYDFVKRIPGGLITVAANNKVVSLRKGGFGDIPEASQDDLAYLKSQGHLFIGVKHYD